MPERPFWVAPASCYPSSGILRKPYVLRPVKSECKSYCYHLSRILESPLKTIAAGSLRVNVRRLAHLII